MDILTLINDTRNKINMKATFRNLTFREVEKHSFLDDKLSHPIEIETYAGFEFTFKIQPIRKSIGITGKGRYDSIESVAKEYGWVECDIFPLNLDFNHNGNGRSPLSRYKSSPVSVNYNISDTMYHKTLCDISKTIKDKFNTNPRLILSYNNLDKNDLRSIQYDRRKVASYSISCE